MLCTMFKCTKRDLSDHFLSITSFITIKISDAKRDLRDLGLGSYAEENGHNMGRLSYGSFITLTSTSKKKKGKRGKSKAKPKTGNYDEGVMFLTYNALIVKSKHGTRLEQLIEWCGGDNPEEFDGLISKKPESSTIHLALLNFISMSVLSPNSTIFIFKCSTNVTRPRQSTLMKMEMPATLEKGHFARRRLLELWSSRAYSHEHESCTVVPNCT